jgi:hypothetical protein
MPFKSEAQRKYMNAAAARGEIPKATVDEFNQASKGKKLPEKKKDRFKRIKKMCSGGMS